MEHAKKILIVEDEAPMRRALVDSFTEEKFQVVEAGDGVEGLKKALEEYPDLILLDVVMPRMDGPSMLKELRKDKWGRGVPVIFLTNLNDAEKIVEATAGGAAGYLVKFNWKLEDVVKKVKDRLKLT